MLTTPGEMSKLTTPEKVSKLTTPVLDSVSDHFRFLRVVEGGGDPTHPPCVSTHTHTPMKKHDAVFSFELISSLTGRRTRNHPRN